jgi:2-oxo-hept-3-ene-1,7-dioate hydratase
MKMTPEQTKLVGEVLFEAEITGAQIGIPSLAHPDMDMDDAYAVQFAFVAKKIAAGRKVIGWKIGLTSKAMRYALGIDIPDSGLLFDDMSFDNHAIIPKGRFIESRVEAEIAFVMKSDVEVVDVTRKQIIAATDYVAPALEILDTIADNAGIVLGDKRHAIAAHDLRWVGVIVSCNAEVEETGLGADVLNGPVENVVWLARRMAQYGQKIKAGQVILSGSFIRPIECPSGSVISADYGAFGRVEVSFA